MENTTFNFIKASDIRKNFTVKGKYYTYKTESQQINCRSLLRITNNDATDKKSMLVIMMNPGSSKPSDPNHECAEISSIKDLKYIPLIDAKPDVTQYQIMRIMTELNYSEAEVINLYDIREAESAKFFRKVSNGFVDLETSIFSINRSEELAELFHKHLVVILAWGDVSKINQTEKIALEKISLFGKKVFSVKLEPRDFIRHPSPQNQIKKMEWLNIMIEQLKN